MAAIDCCTFRKLVPIIRPATFIRPDTILVNSIVIKTNICVNPLTSLHNSCKQLVIRTKTGVRSNYVVRNCYSASAVIKRGNRVKRKTVLRNYIVNHSTLIKVGDIVVSNTIVNRRDVITTVDFIGTNFRNRGHRLLVNAPTHTMHDIDSSRLR